MKEFGYARADLGAAREPGWLAVRWAELRALPSTLHYLAAYWQLSRQLRDPAQFDSVETAALFRRVNPGSWARYPGFEMPIAPPLKALGAGQSPAPA
jgi:hypothetical protein